MTRSNSGDKIAVRDVSVDGWKLLILRGLSCFAVEGLSRPIEEAPSLLGPVPDRGHADQPVSAERGQHVEDDPRLGRVVEVKLFAKGEVEDVVWLQGSVGLGLESIGGHEELRLPGGR